MKKLMEKALKRAMGSKKENGKEQEMGLVEKKHQKATVNMKKREIIRQSKLADLQDCVIEEMSQRLTKRSDNFSNDDLIKYLSAIDKSMINKPELTMDDIPKILINQQNNVQVNINGKEKLSGDERRRVLNAINQLLHSQGDADMVLEGED